MSELALNSKPIRSQSAHPKNYKNIELHAYLDDAKIYRNKVKQHLAQSKFQNHVLQSAQRFYQKEQDLRPSSSQISLNIRSKLTSSTKGDGTSYGFLNLESKLNPESRLVSGLSQKAFRISEIKNGFDFGIEEKEDLKRRIEELKQKIVQQKNKKAKISIKNGKLMNAAESSNYRIGRLQEQSRRNQILISQLLNDINIHETDNDKLQRQNQRLRKDIERENSSVNSWSEVVSNTKQQLQRQKKLMDIWKQKQTVSYKSMTNEYMNLNKLKEEKALLLNCIDLDVKNSL